MGLNNANQALMTSMKKRDLFKNTVLALLLIGSSKLTAQVLHPVKWSYAAKKGNNGEAVVFLKAEIEDGWHIYSTRQKDAGPVKTSFTFKPLTGYALLGKVSEPAPVTKYEPSFAMNVHYFEHSVVFQQKIKLKKVPAEVKGQLEFMVCNDQKCLPPEDLDFSIPVK
jgi:DsbC/DsbD-like thiol-disulfide interchange protein